MPVSSATLKTGLVPILRTAMPYCVLGLAVIAAYCNIFGNAFLYDDNLLIEINSYLRGWSHVGDILTTSTTSGAHIDGGFYRPLQMLLYLLLFHLGSDGTTVWFHVLNLSLHAANTCFVYKLGTKLGFKPWGVFLASLVWGLHPLHTEAVTYMSATADPLFVFFCLWALVVLLPDFTLRKIWQIIPLFLLGLLSKETTVIFPLLVMTCMFLTSPRRLDLRSYRPTWPLWIIALCYAVWRLHAVDFFGPQHAAHLAALPDYALIRTYSDHLLYRVITFFATLPAYFALMLLPQNLHINRDFPFYTDFENGAVIAGLGMTILAAAQIVRGCRKPNNGIEMSWGLLWFAAAQLPDSGILIPADAIFFEHWMYLPSVGLFLGLGETLAKIAQNHQRTSLIFSGIVLTFAAFMAVKTYDQNKIWHDPVTFYTNIIDHSQKPAIAHSNLANYYLKNGRYDEAIEHYNRAIEISDSFAATRFNLAYAYMLSPAWRDHIQDMISNLQGSLELDPNYYRSDELLADIYNDLGDKDKAIYFHDRAEEILVRQK